MLTSIERRQGPHLARNQASSRISWFFRHWAKCWTTGASSDTAWPSAAWTHTHTHAPLLLPSHVRQSLCSGNFNIFWRFHVLQRFPWSKASMKWRLQSCVSAGSWRLSCGCFGSLYRWCTRYRCTAHFKITVTVLCNIPFLHQCVQLCLCSCFSLTFFRLPPAWDILPNYIWISFCVTGVRVAVLKLPGSFRLWSMAISHSFHPVGEPFLKDTWCLDVLLFLLAGGIIL